MSAIFVNIDRIVLSGMDVRPEWAEWIKERAEIELRRLLEREGLPDGLANTGVLSLSLSTIQLSDTTGAAQLANSLARDIIRVLQSAG